MYSVEGSVKSMSCVAVKFTVHSYTYLIPLKVYKPVSVSSPVDVHVNIQKWLIVFGHTYSAAVFKVTGEYVGYRTYMCPSLTCW